MGKGILRTIKAYLERNKLGELLVLQGKITPHQLRELLFLQKETRKPLGRLAVEQAYVSKHALHQTLFRQFSLRCMMAAFTLCLSFSTINLRSAFAEVAQTPEKISSKVVKVSASEQAFKPLKGYPSLFDSLEKRSADISAFTKWSNMFKRYERSVKSYEDAKIIKAWETGLQRYKDLPLKHMARKVNDLVNQKPYIADSRNWGRSDYWATPVEFIKRGGDCEDFAIAKYASLKALGVPEERLRIAIVYDKLKNIPHAILIVYTDNGSLMLDNQIKQISATNKVRRYRPIFSINKLAWWLHSEPAPTVVASAQ